MPTTLTDDSQMGTLAGRMAAPLQRLAPPSAAEARKLQRQLMHAGYRSENGPVIYRGLQLLSLVIFPAFVAMVCAVLGRPLNSAVSWIVVAFAVDDSFQGKGLATLLLERLAIRAAQHGFEKFQATTLADNSPMLEVLSAS